MTTYLVIGIIAIVFVGIAALLNREMAPWEIEEYVNRDFQKGS